MGMRIFNIAERNTYSKNSVVAYGALVTNTIDRENVLYGGVPAKMIKENISWRE